MLMKTVNSEDQLPVEWLEVLSQVRLTAGVLLISFNYTPSYNGQGHLHNIKGCNT